MPRSRVFEWIEVLRWSKKLRFLKKGIGIAEKTYKTRRDRGVVL